MSNRKQENLLAEKWVRNLKLQVKEANEHINIFKIHGHKEQQKGISDYLACYRGRFIAIEFKMEDELLTDYQKEFLDLTCLAGGKDLVIRFRKNWKKLYPETEKDILIRLIETNEIFTSWPY